MNATDVPRGRRPGPSDTREEILVAARELFAGLGYERATMRAIARQAGVDPALIVHYFDSKSGLLAAALKPPVDVPGVLAGVSDDPDRIGEELVRRFLSVWDDPVANRHLMGMLRTGVSHEGAMAALRDTMERTVLSALAGLVEDDTAPLRAALVASQTSGLVLTRYVFRLPEVTALSADQLARLVGPSVQRYLTAELDVRTA